MSDVKKKVDSEWKKKAEEEKVVLEKKAEEAQREADEPLPPPTFPAFVAGLAIEARMALGEIAHPVTKEAKKDLVAARYVIDTIAMLQEKTKGNLETSEDILLQNVLTELRFKFVEASKAK